jgi:hypothetical protein
MKKLLPLLHTYGGLLIFPVLIILGISALNVNHHFDFLRPKQNWTETHAHVNIVNNADNRLLAEAIRDSLLLTGRCQNFNQKRDSGLFRFAVGNNGAEYRLEVKINTGEIKIRRRATGFGAVLNSLHFFNGKLPKSNWLINGWQYYKIVFLIYFLISIISGIYLLVTRRKNPTTAIIIIGSAVLFTILLMIYVWKIG